MIGAVLVLLGCGEAPEPEAPCTLQTFFADADGDGYGDPFAPAEACEVPDGFTDNFADCDDADSTWHPEAIWYADADGDGYGDAASSLQTCARPLGHVVDSTDCDDADSTRYPGAQWYTDGDGDGHGDGSAPIDACGSIAGAVPTGEDCDDADDTLHPDANEVCDGIDNDCDGAVDDDDPGVDPYTFSPLWVDDDGDGYGGTVSFGEGCAAVEGGVLVQGDCDDTDGYVFPTQTDYADDLDADCDGEPWYQYVAQLWPAHSGDTLASDLGYHLDTRDITGDGVPDLLIGMSATDEDAGQVVWSDGAAALEGGGLSEETVRWSGEAAGDLAGWSAVWVDDLTGDGTPDALIGAYGAGDGGGTVYLMSADAPSGSLSEATARWGFTDHDAQFGEALLALEAGALIAAPEHTGARSRSGAIFLLTDSTADLKDLPSIEGIDGGDELGESMAVIGDVDGDGQTDLLLGADKADVESGGNEGEAYVVPLADLESGAVDLTAAETWQGIAADDHAGERVSSAGDVNGDGFDDFLIGAPDADPSGAVWLILGASQRPADRALSDADAVFLGPSEEDETLGETLAGVGDADGDGLDDLALAATNAEQASTTGENPTSNVGRVYVFLGGDLSGSWSALSDSDLMVQGDLSGDRVGRSLSAPGDVTGDGLDDLWIGATGTADDQGAFYLLSGAALP